MVILKTLNNLFYKRGCDSNIQNSFNFLSPWIKILSNFRIEKNFLPIVVPVIRLNYRKDLIQLMQLNILFLLQALDLFHLLFSKTFTELCFFALRRDMCFCGNLISCGFLLYQFYIITLYCKQGIYMWLRLPFVFNRICSFIRFVIRCRTFYCLKIHNYIFFLTFKFLNFKPDKNESCF